MVLPSKCLNLLYPRTCPACARYIGGQQNLFCDRCMHRLPRTEQAHMRQNVTETTLIGPVSDIVAGAKTMHLEKAAAFLFYDKDHPIQRVIHKMKYADQPMIGYFLGRQAAIEFQYADFFDEIDVIIPIPLHPKRLNERGYNQSEYIAKGISDVIGKPVDLTHVTRTRNTPKQALQSGDERRENMEEAFAVHHPEQLYHKHILVVDDLITTGETMRSCLKAMKIIRGAKFTVFALCKAR